MPSAPARGSVANARAHHTVSHRTSHARAHELSHHPSSSRVVRIDARIARRTPRQFHNFPPLATTTSRIIASSSSSSSTTTTTTARRRRLHDPNASHTHYSSVSPSPISRARTARSLVDSRDRCRVDECEFKSRTPTTTMDASRTADADDASVADGAHGQPLIIPHPNRGRTNAVDGRHRRLGRRRREHEPTTSSVVVVVVRRRRPRRRPRRRRRNSH